MYRKHILMGLKAKYEGGIYMDFELIAGGSAMLVILGVVELVKSVLGIDAKLAPIISVCLGLVFSIVYSFYGDTVLYEAIIMGLIVGLGAIGLYSGPKNTIEKFKQ
jgi:hypothetical protein